MLKQKLSHRPPAFALVVVLVFVSLVVAMAVLFLASVAHERRGVALYAASSETEHLANVAVNRVMGQINAATREGTASVPVSWASQPGMIRTYSTSGEPQNVYKLYSWDNAVEPGTDFDPTSSEELPPSDWNDRPAEFVDLNQATGGVYPIVDPSVVGAVEGFSIDSNAAAITGAGLAAPMPVRWLYFLEDGQLVTPEPGTDTVTVSGATATNPIVGRIAFWTDDETSKVNINTASEGVFYDLPLSAFRDDIQFSANPPVRYEFQRTPGHPAMTSLSAVFPEFVPDENLTDRTQSRWSSNYRTQVEDLYKMTPRIDWGGVVNGVTHGSLGGTYPYGSYNYAYPPAAGTIPDTPREIVLDVDRLYASPEELWFSAPVSGPSGPRSSQDTFNTASLTPTDLQRRGFFLCSSSRSPETTLFETPRVSLWPITWPHSASFYLNRSVSRQAIPGTSDPNSDTVGEYDEWITAQERLLAFDATLNASAPGGGDRWFFQRKDPESPAADWDRITRNQELVRYLSRMIASDPPGFSGGSLSNTVGGDSGADWLAFNSLNFSRSLVNQFTAAESTEGVRYSFAGVAFKNGRMRGVNGSMTEPNGKTVVPLRATLNATDGEIVAVGNYPLLEEVSMVFYAAQRREPVPPTIPSTVPMLSTGPPDNAPPNTPDSSHADYPDWRNPLLWTNLINPGPTYGGVDALVYPIGSQTEVLRGVMLLDFNNLEPGVDVTPVFWVKVKGTPFRANGSSLGLPSANGLVAQIKLDSGTNNNKLTEPLRVGARAKIFANDAAPANNVWQLASNDIVVQPTDLTFGFSGSRITVEVYACNPADIDDDPTDTPELKIYEKEVDFGEWSGTLPMPIAPRWSTMSRSYAPALPSGSDALPGGTGTKAGIPMDDKKEGPRWRPNPGLDAASSWAWAEFAPYLVGRGTAASTRDAKSGSAPRIKSTRNRGKDMITYYYRPGLLSGYTPNPTDDPDDKRESLIPAISANLSTNFRKRVEGVKQRQPNDGSRVVFNLEGVSQTDYDNATGTERQGLDLFVNFTETPLNEAPPLLTPYDTVISMVATSASDDAEMDPRLSASPVTVFAKISDVLDGDPDAVIDPVLYPRPTSGAQWHQFGTAVTQLSNVTGYQRLPMYRNKDFGQGSTLAVGGSDNTGIEAGSGNFIPDTADWTGMPGRYADGGLLLRPDQEYSIVYQDTANQVYMPFWPRILYTVHLPSDPTITDISYFSPNRQIPSPIVLGTLPRSATSEWQTLAFSPNPSSGSAHPGRPTSRNAVGDHLLLDLFWMPVAEPYPISDQFSTAGKINLNSQIVPFTYIERKTGLYAVMKNTWMTALPTDDDSIANYKDKLMLDSTEKSRFAIDPEETLKGFDEVFDSGDIFRSATQICNMFLVPQGFTLSSVRTGNEPGTFWQERWLTSDNAREQPYNHLYSRITTKSDTYTVHWRVQALRKTPNTPPDEWIEGRDQAVAELRGSSLIERYIDPNATDIPDYATEVDAEPLSRFYDWRTVQETYFQP